MEKEEWRQIGETIYFVSSLGRVKSTDHIVKRKKYGSFLKKGRIKKQTWISKNFMMTCLVINGKAKNCSVSRLVATAFLDNPENKEQVNHIDGNRKNNRVENLEWCTPQENIEHALNTGLIKKRVLKPLSTKPNNTGSKNYKAIFVENDILQIRALNKLGWTNKKIREIYHCSSSNISNIVRGNTWRHVV